MKYLALFLIPFAFACSGKMNSSNSLETSTLNTMKSLENSSAVDYVGFIKLTKKLEPIREKRLISTDVFNKMAQEPNTLILDTRSKAAYDEVHIKGAVHLNFSDFTEKKLAKVIPSKDTRILIYCNNNFELPFEALLAKKVDLALNIPTFINLYGYGYENIYELGDMVSNPHPNIVLEGSKVMEPTAEL